MAKMEGTMDKTYHLPATLDKQNKFILEQDTIMFTNGQCIKAVSSKKKNEKK